MPIDAGQTKDVKLKVTPPNTAAAGRLQGHGAGRRRGRLGDHRPWLDITGQPRLDVSGREGLVSTRASAGKEKSVPVVITNTGTAPAEDVRALRLGAERLEDYFRSEVGRSHRAE